MRLREGALLGIAAFIPTTPIVWVTESYAQQYLTLEEAKRATFPEASHFDPAVITLSDEQQDLIEERSGVRVPRPKVERWRVYKGEELLGELMFDQVIGKHLLIDYVLAVTPERTVRSVEILEYRENYGGEIRDEEWRRSFVGKTVRDPVKIRKDIPNISGATYSTVHMSEGVRRLLATLEVVEARG